MSCCMTLANWNYGTLPRESLPKRGCVPQSGMHTNHERLRRFRGLSSLANNTWFLKRINRRDRVCYFAEFASGECWLTNMQTISQEIVACRTRSDTITSSFGGPRCFMDLLPSAQRRRQVPDMDWVWSSSGELDPGSTFWPKPFNCHPECCVLGRLSQVDSQRCV
jgi:hypothetical protein